jgi:hypothetical protein
VHTFARNGVLEHSVHRELLKQVAGVESKRTLALQTNAGPRPSERMTS